MTKDEVFNLCAYTKNGCILRENVFKKKFQDIYSDIQKIKFPDKFTFVQKLYHYLCDDLEFKKGICPECGNRCGFISLRSGYHIYCCNNCQRHSDIVKQKRECTTFQRYGVTNAYASEQIKEKIKNAHRAKRGVDYPGEDKEVKEKIKQVKYEKYGDPYFTNREKSKNTYLTHRNEYGEPWLHSIKEKIKNTNRKKYGTDYSMQNAAIRKKAIDTNLKKYGVKNYIELPEIRLKSRAIQKNNNGKSYLENAVFEYIQSLYKNDIIKNDRFVLDGKEIDIFLPNINVGFEINGDFWHMNPCFYNESDVNSKLGMTAEQIWEYDDFKIKMAESKNVSLFIIWEHDWKYNNQVIKDKIKYIISHNVSVQGLEEH